MAHTDSARESKKNPRADSSVVAHCTMPRANYSAIGIIVMK